MDLSGSVECSCFTSTCYAAPLLLINSVALNVCAFSNGCVSGKQKRANVIATAAVGIYLFKIFHILRQHFQFS